MVPSRAGEFRELGEGSGYGLGSVLRLRKCLSLCVCVFFKPTVFVICACTRVFVYLKIWLLHIRCTPSCFLHTHTHTLFI